MVALVLGSGEVIGDSRAQVLAELVEGALAEGAEGAAPQGGEARTEGGKERSCHTGCIFKAPRKVQSESPDGKQPPPSATGQKLKKNMLPGC